MYFKGIDIGTTDLGHVLVRGIVFRNGEKAERVRGGNRAVPFAKATVLASGYGLLIEIYQAMLPWRTFGLDDLVWNTVGVLFFLALLRWKLSQ